MKNTQVCLISPKPPPMGGIGRWTTIILANSLAATRCNISHINSSPIWRKSHDFKILSRLFDGLISMCCQIIGLFALIIDNKAHVIHLTSTAELSLVRDVVILVLSKCMRRSLVYHIRVGSLPELRQKRSAQWSLIMFIIRNSRRTIVLDRITYNTIRDECKIAAVVIVPNCHDMPLADVQPIDNFSSGPSVLYLGWVLPSKGTTDLISAWMSIERKENWKLIVAGPGDPDYMSSLMSRSDDSVEFTGGVEHTRAMKLLRAASIFTLPSHSEGFPNSVVEAMCFGKPIVASRVGAIPEMLLNGRCGLLVDHNSPESIKLALTRLMGNDFERTHLGHLAKLRAVRSYGVSTIMGRYSKIWTQCRIR